MRTRCSICGQFSCDHSEEEKESRDRNEEASKFEREARQRQQDLMDYFGMNDDYDEEDE